MTSDATVLLHPDPRQQLAALAKRFPPAVIHSRQVGGGRDADYVPASVVAEKLLAVLGPFSWSTSFGPDGCLVGTITATVDGREVSVSGIGQGDDYKAAESDALKRAARWLGCGLHLWSGDDYRLDRALRTTDDD